MIISIVSLKGSVSKTTTALNVAAALLEIGHEVALLDLDVQQDLTAFRKGLKGAHWLDPHDFQTALSEPSLTLIDCPPRLDPATDEGRRSLQAIALSDICLIPTPPEKLALRGFGRMQQMVKAIQKSHNPALQMRVLTAMYQGGLHAERRNEMKAQFGKSLCRTTIPRANAVVQATDAGRSVLANAPTSNAAKAYRRLTKEILQWQK